jgi:hypothetical protein
MMKKIATFVTTTALLCALSAGSAFAFTDLDAAEQGPIMALKEKGIVSGVDSEHFVPRGKVSYAQSVSMLVKGLQLTIDPIKFVKKPEATDYFTNVPNDAWYADALVIAKINGLNIPKDVDPNATITREQYADLLIHAMDTKGTFPVIQMFIVLADEEQVDKQYMTSLQRIYLHGFAKLDEKRMAYPKREMSRGEAAVWLNNAIKYVQDHGSVKPQPPVEQEQVKVTVEQVYADVNKVTLSRQMPNPGYGFAITGIQFQTDGTAVIAYSVSEPDPGKSYIQVITEAKAETYVSSKYKPVAQQSAVSIAPVENGGSTEPSGSTASSIIH